MSRTTASINRIKKKLDEISGLTGIVSDIVELEEKRITDLVEYIKRNHSRANLFNYYGINGKTKDGDGE